MSAQPIVDSLECSFVSAQLGAESLECSGCLSWSTGLLESWSTEHTEPRSAHALSPIGLRPGYLDRQAPPGTSRELSKTSHTLAETSPGTPGNFPGTFQNVTYPRRDLPRNPRELPGNFPKHHIPSQNITYPPGNFPGTSREHSQNLALRSSKIC